MGWHGVLVSNMGKQYHFEIHGDEQMATQSNIHFFTNWAKERLDEMDAAVTSLEGKLAEVQSDARDKADEVLADLRKPFRDQDLLEAVEADLARNRARRPAAPFLSVGLAPPTKSEFRTTNAR